MSGAPEPAGVFALITGGGTGGHVQPALAIGEELVRRGHPRSSIRYVGSRRGLEATAVPAAGFEIDLLSGRGLRRRLDLPSVRANVGALWGNVRALVRALGIVRRHRPHVVLGVGGYASLPCVLAARLRRVPMVVHEQNRAPGLANRIAVRLGARAAVSIPDTPLPGAVLTGNPVRAAIAAVERAPVDPPLVVVVGGSLGAVRLNDATIALYERWRDREDLAIRHVTGERNAGECARRLALVRRSEDRLHYELVGYEEHMERCYERAAVVVARSGAVTVAELAVTGTPSILVPLPGAPGDHQTRNASALVELGAAVMVPDAELDGERLGVELETLLGDDARRAAMGVAARRLGRPDATAAVADLVEAAARGLRP